MVDGGWMRPVDFGVKSGLLGVEIWGFGSEIWVFFVVKGGWLRPVHFGVKSGHFGFEIWGF